MSDQTPPKIAFPCRYSIRVIGVSSADFHLDVVDIVRPHAPEIDTAEVKVKPSSKGNFSSVYLVIEATGEAQLSAIHQALQAHPDVRMVI